MMDFDQMLQALKTVGSVPHGCKLGHGRGGSLYVCPPGLVAGVKRRVWGEGRDRGCATIRCLLNACFERLTDMEHSRYATEGGCQENDGLQQRARQLVEAMRSCQQGMEAMQVTYCTDTAVAARLDVLKDKCGLLVKRAAEFLAGMEDGGHGSGSGASFGLR